MAATWGVEGYTHRFEAEWVAFGDYPAGSEISKDGSFNLLETGAAYPGYVLWPPGTPRAHVGGACLGITEMQPKNPTRFLAGWVTPGPMSYSDAEAFFSNLTARVVCDRYSGPLARHEIVPFSADNIYPWTNCVCTFTETP